MSTVAEIKEAIDSLAPHDRAELEAILWPDEETPPAIRVKLEQALRGSFYAGDRAKVGKILSGLE